MVRFTKAAKSTPKATMAGTMYAAYFSVPPGTRARLWRNTAAKITRNITGKMMAPNTLWALRQ